MSYAITGIKKGLGPGDAVPLRREIDEWWTSKDNNDLNQRSLFIYALHEFQSMSPDDQMSYFAVAGIHGQPLTPWDPKVPKNSWYCTHGTPLFPPWHRPYLLLYEQRLYELMLKLIPTTFAQEDQAAMIHAAETWRLPYWDWAMRKPDWHSPNDPTKFGPNVPFIITLPNVEVKTKTGVATVPNPMWKFSLPADPKRKTFGDYGITKDGTLPFDKCKATVRYPSTANPANPNFTSAWVNGDKQNWDPITGQLRGAKVVDSNTLPEAVYRLFVEEYLPTYNDFATEGYTTGQPPTYYSSLEDIHGQIHVLTGGSGHMSRVGVAAFDPIFWMHHCNVDRIFAMWQDLYPNKYVQTFTSGRGTTKPNDGLAPFSTDTKSTPWNATLCRYTTDCGYAYPELQKWLDVYKTAGKFDLAKYQKALRSTIEIKYSTTGKSTLQLPENSGLADAHLMTLPAMNLAVENFPPKLVKKVQELQAEGAQSQPFIQASAVTSKPVAAAAVQGSPSQQVPMLQAGATAAAAAADFLTLANSPSAAQHPIAAPAPSPVAKEKWKENDYIVNVLFDRFALDGYPYSIRIFLGDVPDANSSLLFADTPTQVGLVYNFSAPAEHRGTTPTGCANCLRQQEDHEMSTGQVILTDYLVEHITKSIETRGLTLESLAREDVVAYLKENLHWRVTDIDDNVIPKEQMPSLKVSVAMGRATHFIAVDVPSKYENYEVLYEVSEGRLAGAVRGDLN